VYNGMMKEETTVIVYEHHDGIVIDILDKRHWMILSTCNAKRLGRILLKWAEKKEHSIGQEEC